MHFQYDLVFIENDILEYVDVDLNLYVLMIFIYTYVCLHMYLFIVYIYIHGFMHSRKMKTQNATNTH